MLLVTLISGVFLGSYGTQSGWIKGTSRVHNNAQVVAPVGGDFDTVIVSGGGGASASSAHHVSSAEELELLLHEVATVVETKATSALVIETAVPVVSTEAVLRALPLHDPFVAESTSRLRTCAVVGNSGILRDARLGVEIDAHDAVFRFNWPPIAEAQYRADLGRKTTHMFVGAFAQLRSRFPPFAGAANFSRDINVLYELRAFDDWHQFVANLNETMAPTRQYALSQFFLKLSDSVSCASQIESVSKRRCRASTGMRGVLAAALMCESVDVYGFGTAPLRGHAPFWFDDKHAMREAPIFDYHIEMRIIRDMVAKKPPGVMRRLPLAAMALAEVGAVHKDSFSHQWMRLAHLSVYNGAESSTTSVGIDKREPPLADDAKYEVREPVSRVYALVNNAQPPSYWDYHHFEMPYSNKTYRKGTKLGSGTYGDVYRAADPWPDGRQVVLKYLHKQTSRPWILSREVLILRALGGKRSTIELLDVTFAAKEEMTVLVFPLIHIASYHSLYYSFEDIHIRYYTFKLFDSLAYAHSKGILHNDVKPLNLLIDSGTHEQYLADWGLGEYYFPPNNTDGPNITLSFHVGTRHWKAPELLLGAHHYSYAVDIWSAGCTFIGILFHRTHFFAGTDNQDQIVVITQMLGTRALDDYLEKYAVPMDERWYFKHIRQWNKKSWASQFTAQTERFYRDGVDELLDKIMVMDPEQRATADEVLAHRYFDPVRDMDKPPVWTWLEQRDRPMIPDKSNSKR